MLVEVVSNLTIQLSVCRLEHLPYQLATFDLRIGCR
jgi:hypothetical protein